MRKFLRAVLPVGLLLAGPATAQVADWQGLASENWFNALNWSPEAIPGAGTNVLINTTAPNPTTLSTSSTPDLGAIQVGETGTGDLWIELGGKLNNGGIGMLGTQAGSLGFMTVDGAGSEWRIDHNLVVGEQGAGTLRLRNEAYVLNHNGRIGNSASGSGAVTVWSNSNWVNLGNLFVAHTGTGSLDVRSGAAVFNQAQAFVGYAEGSEGNVLVRENGGWASLDDLVIGRLGQGQLTIESGGLVVLAEDSRSLLGTHSGGWGQASVTGSGSRWINSGGLIIGLNGGGLVEIVDGAQVEAGIVSIADSGPGTGVVIVGPDGQLSSESTLFVGRAGIGSLSIDAGEVVNSGAFIAASPGATGEVHLLSLSGPGARWHSLGNLVVGYQGDGLLTLAEGTEVEADGQVRIASIAGSSGTIRVFDSGSLSASAAHGGTLVRNGGRVEGNGTITGGLTVQSGGVVAPATSSGTIGTLRVTGALNMESPDSILEFKLSNFSIPPDPVAPIADRIEVDGDLTLNGTLNATVTGTFIPGAYTLLTYTGTLVDNGLTIGSLPAPPDGYSARIDASSQPGEVRLVVEPASDSLFSDRFES